jgi:hypothetical protein
MTSTSQTDTGPGRPDQSLEQELSQAEQRLRHEREHPAFGEHPHGVGQTLGGDLAQPNPGHDVEWNDEDYDPPT